MPGPGGKSRVSGAFQIRKQGKDSYQIGVPRHIGEALYEQGRYFVGQLAEDGIIFKPLDTISPEAPTPAWVDGVAKADAD